ncbi:MAG: hypothetical protein ABFD08_12975 [Syntrophomonas sp.]
MTVSSVMKTMRDEPAYKATKAGFCPGAGFVWEGFLYFDNKSLSGFKIFNPVFEPGISMLY